MADLLNRLRNLERILGQDSRVKLEMPEYGGTVWLDRVDSTKYSASYDLTSYRGRFLLNVEAKIVQASITEKIDGTTIATPDQIKIFNENADVRERAVDELIEKLLAKKELANN